MRSSAWITLSLAAIAMVLNVGAVAEGSSPQAIYDPLTGGITFSGVDDLLGLRIDSRGLLSGGFATDLDGAVGGDRSVVNDQAPNFIEWGNLGSMTFGNSFAGNVLPVGLTLDELVQDFSFVARHSSAPANDILGSFVLGEYSMLSQPSSNVRPQPVVRDLPPLPQPVPLPPVADPQPAPMPMLGSAIAEYDPLTGGMWFLNVQDLAGLRLDSASNLLLGGQQTDLDGFAQGEFSTANDQAPRFMEWGNLSGMSFERVFAGNVLPTGLTVEQLVDDLTFRTRTLESPGIDQLGTYHFGDQSIASNPLPLPIEPLERPPVDPTPTVEPAPKDPPPVEEPPVESPNPDDVLQIDLPIHGYPIGTPTFTWPIGGVLPDIEIIDFVPREPITWDLTDLSVSVAFDFVDYDLTALGSDLLVTNFAEDVGSDVMARASAFSLASQFADNNLQPVPEPGVYWLIACLFPWAASWRRLG